MRRRQERRRKRDKERERGGIRNRQRKEREKKEAEGEQGRRGKGRRRRRKKIFKDPAVVVVVGCLVGERALMALVRVFSAQGRKKFSSFVPSVLARLRGGTRRDQSWGRPGGWTWSRGREEEEEEDKTVALSALFCLRLFRLLGG